MLQRFLGSLRYLFALLLQGVFDQTLQAINIALIQSLETVNTIEILT